MDSIMKCCCSLIFAFVFCFFTLGNAGGEMMNSMNGEEAAPAHEMMNGEMKCEEGFVFDDELEMCIIEEPAPSEE